MIISVTGSKEIDLEISESRIEEVLKPYLNIGNKWLIGFGGKTDEIVLKKLLSTNEDLTVVKNIAENEPDEMKQLIKEKKLKVIDPHKLQMPIFKDAPSKRDLYMLLNSEFSIIFWNSKSEYTRNLINWYLEKGKNFLVGFLN